jgi:hypothetical protein
MAGKFEHLYQTAPDCSRSLGAFIALETDGGGHESASIVLSLRS